MQRTLGLAIAVVLCCVAVARAEPLNLKNISADAKWAAHLDVDALVNSSIVQNVSQQVFDNHPRAASFLAAIREVWKFNPCTDLHGITIYGTKLQKDSGVAIVNAQVDANLVLEKAKQAPEYRVSAYGKYELHSWIHAKGSPHERSMIGTLYKPNVLVFGASAPEVMAALDVLDGTKPCFGGAQTSSNAVTPPGTVLVAGVTDLANAKLPGKSPLTQHANAIVVMMGENQGEVFVKGWLNMKQTETAQQAKAVLEGGLAQASLASSDDAELTKLIAAAKVAVDDKTVTLEWKAPADAVLLGMQRAIIRAAAAHKDEIENGPIGRFLNPK